MLRRDSLNGQLPAIPFSCATPRRLSLRDDPAPPVVEVPKDLDPKVIAHIETQAVDKYKNGLPKVPEKYDGLKLPAKTMLGETSFERTAATARKLGLTNNEAAQALIDFAHGEVTNVTEALADQHKKQVEEWEQLALNSADLGGGKPENFQAHVARVNRVVKKFFPDSIQRFLDEHGLGSHPDFLRGMSKLADLAKEDKLELGAPGGGEQKSHAERIYGKK